MPFYRVKSSVNKGKKTKLKNSTSRNTNWYNSMDVYQKIKNRKMIWSSNSSSGYFSKKENEYTNWKRYVQSNVNDGIIHSSQDLETMPVPIDRWMDKESVNIHALRFYSASQKDILSLWQHRWTWRTLSEISQTQKHDYSMILRTWRTQNSLTPKSRE